MTHESPKSGELFRLLSELVDNTLTESEVERLRELLRDDPRAQDLYRNYMGVHAQLYLDYGSGSTPIAMPGGSSMPLAPAPALITPIGLDLNNGEASETAAKTLAAPASLPRSSWPLALAFGVGLAAALLLIGLALMLSTRDRRGAPDVAPTKAPAGAVVQRPTPVARGDEIALVVKLDQVRWEDSEGLHLSEGDLLGQGHIGLRSGRLTLAFLNGVLLTLEGPADLELISIDRVICHRGKIRTHVPAGAEGFVVSAPGSDVTDLGTDLGINVFDDDGKTRVMVFEGTVDASVLNADGSAQRNRNVTKHHALEIDPVRFQLNDAEVRTGSFVALPTLATPTLVLAPSYRDEVMKARPWSYWRFESMDGGVVPNEVAGRPPLRVTGPVRLAGAGNRSAAFGPDVPEQYMVMDGPWEPSRDPGYALELWFSPERIGLAELACLFIPMGGIHYQHLFQLELTSKNRDSFMFHRASLRFMYRWPPGYQGGDNLFSDYYVPYRWHHAVAQMRGDQMELYVNGTPLPTLTAGSDRVVVSCHLILGQLKPAPRPDAGWASRPFVGQIDEVALYDHPLSIEEVRRHHVLGPRGAGRPDREP